MLFLTARRQSYSLNLEEKMRITHEGNVGVGTTEPAEKLHVKGNIAISTDANYRVGTTMKVFNVLDYGTVDRTGNIDATNVFQAAINAAASTDSANIYGGGIVHAPTGVYKISTHLTIPAGVTLQGEWQSPHNWLKSDMKGTVLEAYETGSTPFITLNGISACLKGVTIYYPNQSINTDSNTPTIAYPWCIKGVRDHVSIIDVLMVNPYKGINIDLSSTQSANNNGGYLIRGVYGQPLNTGIQIDYSGDVSRIEDVHFWYFWLQGENWPSWGNSARLYQLFNGKALILDGAEWQKVNNFFSYSFQVGIEIKNASCNAELSNISRFW